jgi:PAS domain S-box-containing protein
MRIILRYDDMKKLPAGLAATEGQIAMLSNAHILLIDDSQEQFYLVEGLLLESIGKQFRLDWASTLPQSVELLQEHRYDVCLLDFMLGQANALDILDIFQQHSISTPVIVITGHGSHDIDIAVMKAGAVDFIDKTQLNTKNLERSLRYAVQQARNTELLRQSEERFRLMVEKGSDLIIQLDRIGNFRYLSPSVSCPLGYSETELLNQPIAAYVFEDDLRHLTTMLESVLAKPSMDAPPSGQFRIKSKAGDFVWFECVATNLLNMPGIEAIVINGRDISERQKLLEAEQEQRTISNAFLDTSIALNGTLDFDEIIERLLDNIGNIIPYQRASIMLLDENNQAHAVVARGYPDNPNPGWFHLDIKRFPTFMSMVETAQPLLINDVQANPMWQVIDKTFDCRSYLATPIVEKEEIIGFINLEGLEAGIFKDNHINYLQLFSYLASLAIANARAYQQAHELAALEERQRLARELHDSVSQTLFSASVIADSLSKSDLDDTEKIQTGLEKLTQLNRGALAEMRSLLIELRPQVIINSPLADLVANLTNTIKTRGLMEAELEVAGVSKLFAPDVQLQLYRLIQEVLNNISKHSQAKLVNIVLRYREDSLEIVIADDGIGFDMTTIPSDHHGIAIMRERAAKIGASLSIDTAPNEGTYVRIFWAEGDRSD